MNNQNYNSDNEDLAEAAQVQPQVQHQQIAQMQPQGNQLSSIFARNDIPSACNTKYPLAWADKQSVATDQTHVQPQQTAVAEKFVIRIQTNQTHVQPQQTAAAEKFVIRIQTNQTHVQRLAQQNAVQPPKSILGKRTSGQAGLQSVEESKEPNTQGGGRGFNR